MQMAAAAGVTRLLLIFGLMEQPIIGDNIPETVNQKQVSFSLRFQRGHYQ